MERYGIEYRDYTKLPAIEGAGPAIVCGTAPNWSIELESARQKCPDAPVFGVNRAAIWAPCDYLVTVHPELFKNVSCKIFSDKAAHNVDTVWPIATAGGTSALLAVLIALLMGHSRVVTAGVHLNGDYKSARDRWIFFADQIGERLTSVSPEGTFITDYFGESNGYQRSGNHQYSPE